MKLEDLQAEWDMDSKINRTDISEEAVKVPIQHAKWLTYLSNFRRKLRLLNEKKRKLEMTLTGYFNGDIDGKDIDRPPFQLTLKTKSSVEKFIQNDREIVIINKAIGEIEDNILFCKEVMDCINRKGFAIKSIIDWERFIAGN